MAMLDSDALWECDTSRLRCSHAEVHGGAVRSPHRLPAVRQSHAYNRHQLNGVGRGGGGSNPVSRTVGA